MELFTGNTNPRVVANVDEGMTDIIPIIALTQSLLIKLHAASPSGLYLITKSESSA